MLSLNSAHLVPESGRSGTSRSPVFLWILLRQSEEARRRLEPGLRAVCAHLGIPLEDDGASLRGKVPLLNAYFWPDGAVNGGPKSGQWAEQNQATLAA